MILLFPNFDTLQLALTSTIVPTDVTLAPARVSFDEQGKIYLETDESLIEDGHEEPRPHRREGLETARDRQPRIADELAPGTAGHARRGDAERLEPGPGAVRAIGCGRPAGPRDGNAPPRQRPTELPLVRDSRRSRTQSRVAARDRPAVLHVVACARQERRGNEGIGARVSRTRPASVGRVGIQPPARDSDSRRRPATRAHPRTARMGLSGRVAVPGHLRHHAVQASGPPDRVDGSGRAQEDLRSAAAHGRQRGGHPGTVGFATRTRSNNSTRSSATRTNG